MSVAIINTYKEIFDDMIDSMMLIVHKWTNSPRSLFHIGPILIQFHTITNWWPGASSSLFRCVKLTPWPCQSAKLSKMSSFVYHRPIDVCSADCVHMALYRIQLTHLRYLMMETPNPNEMLLFVMTFALPASHSMLISSMSRPTDSGNSAEL